MAKNVYIHIPFCKSKCYYCSFVSFSALERKKDYLKSLEYEINCTYKNEKLNTIYFGGGTPSLLDLCEFENILKHFNFDKNTEITVEINPDDANFSYLRGLYDLGVNRLSFGAQSFDNEILKIINRRHDSSQITNSVKNSHKAGFKNISLDFIYGLPNQTEDMFINDLKKASVLGVEHISLYGLTIEENCYFYKNKPQNIADDDEQANMYLKAIEVLTSYGYKHYEISNFAKEGFESKHNLNYWNNNEYYGFGVSAHGYLNDIRYGNKLTMDEYVENPLQKNEEYTEKKQNKLEEEIFLGFRKMDGIDVSEINLKYNIDFEEKYLKIIKKYEGLGLLKKTEKGYALTPNGILVSNTIFAEFLE